MSEHDLGQELDRLLTLHREATGEEKAELLEQMIGLFGGIRAAPRRIEVSGGGPCTAQKEN